MSDQGNAGPIRVLLVDDHAILRDGMCALLATEPGIEVVGGGEVEPRLEALDRVGRQGGTLRRWFREARSERWSHGCATPAISRRSNRSATR